MAGLAKTQPEDARFDESAPSPGIESLFDYAKGGCHVFSFLIRAHEGLYGTYCSGKMYAMAAKNDALGNVKIRSKLNIDRVKNLIGIFDKFAKPGTAIDMDILRAAVVLLHATLEDALRGLLALKLPLAPEDLLGKICGDKKMPVIDLAKYRGQTIDDFWGEKIASYLSTLTFNHKEDVLNAIVQIGLMKSHFGPVVGKIGPMITRRHLIVHESDRVPPNEKGHGFPRHIKRSSVEEWTAAVGSFLAKVFSELDRKPTVPV